MSEGVQVKMDDTTVTIEVEDFYISFSKLTGMGRDEIEVIVHGHGLHGYEVVNSKTLLGALKALEASHDKRRTHAEGRERWKQSVNSYLQ